MNVKFIVLAAILATFLVIRLFLNIFLIIWILNFDQLYIIDSITFIAIFLSLGAIIGIIFGKKWGLELSIAYGFFDLILNIIFQSSTSMGGIVINTIQIILSLIILIILLRSDDVFQDDTSNCIYMQQNNTSQQSNQFETVEYQYCMICGEKLINHYCYKCGIYYNSL